MNVRYLVVNVCLTVLKLNIYRVLLALVLLSRSTLTLTMLMLHSPGMSKNGTQVGAGMTMSPLVLISLCKKTLQVLSMLGIM